MLEVVNITKTFPGVKALNQVNMSFYPSKVNAILGENGAGKSTLLNILSGIYTDYEGDVLIDGNKCVFKNTTDSKNAGIAIIHQELNLFSNLSICDNIFLGQELKTSLGLLDYRRMNTICKGLLDQVQIDRDPSCLVENLKIGEQQLVEIARALYSKASIILMDEPTSALSDVEIENLHGLIAKWKEEGKTIIYISHKMEELFKVSDTFSVLRDGNSIASGMMSEITSRELIRHMVGRDVVVKRRNRERTSKEVVLDFEGKFKLHRGEILGFYGLMGAGRTELMEELFGVAKKPISITIEGKKVAIKSPRDAIKNGIGFVTEDRKTEGLIMDRDLVFNISLPSLKDFELLNAQKELEFTQKNIQGLDVKTPSLEMLCGNLSGGNQQKVILGKWLSTHPKILILDEPTRGIDINAKNQIYNLIYDMAEKGLSILFVSSELPEILALSDRVIVMNEGCIRGEFEGATTNEQELMQAALPKRIIHD